MDARSFVRSHLLRLPLAAGLLGALLFTAPRTDAQCFGPDMLDLGPCCGVVTPNLPAFPQAVLPSLGICWNSCNLLGTQDLRVVWSPPSQVACGEYIAQLSVIDNGSGATLLSGLMVLDYTRTWIETDPSGATTQVWRFVAKVDLSSTTGGGTSPCVNPNCTLPAGPYPTAFYYGYVDYASCSAAGPWQNTLVLYHACDRFIHMPGLSDKPGSFHPGRSFAIVAPHSTVQPFVPANAIASSGPLFGEATRSELPGALVCLVEDPVVAGGLTKLGAGCICSFSATPKQQTVRELKGQTACPTATGVPAGFASVDLGFPTFPWLHMVSTSIGFWSNPSVYPGKESCWVEEGVFAVQDACTGDFAEIKYGASTRQGWAVSLPIPVVVDDFTDLADNYTAPLFGPYPGPFVGSVYPTEHLLYVNVP